jgi:hypothetical protein
MDSTLARKWSRKLLTAVTLWLLLWSSASFVLADGSYGSGTYGSCQYNSCGISLTSNGSISLDITPGIGTTCTVGSDTVSVLTDASTGYTLKIADSDTSNQLAGATSGSNVAATSGTAALPSVLSANTWGYRVDGAGGFGAGPTNTQSNGSIPSVSFAAVPLSSGTADTIASTTSAADPADDTTVWFGMCANTSLASDTYTDNIIYTAVVN